MMRVSLYSQLHTSDAKAIADAQVSLLDTLVVDEGAVGAPEIDHFHAVVGRRQPTMNSRHQRRVDDEVGARCAADGFDRSRTQAKGPCGPLKNPHPDAF